MTKWRKSSRSQSSATCVEIANTLDRLRDSKNPDGPALRGNITALIQSMKKADFDRFGIDSGAR